MSERVVLTFLLLTLIFGLAGLSPSSAQEERPGEELLYPIQDEPSFQTKGGTIFKIGARSGVPEGTTCKQILSISSDLDIAGKVEGRVISLWGDVNLAGTAEVDGELIIIGGELKSDPGAKVSGKIHRFSTSEALSGFISLMSGIPRRYWGNVAWISWKVALFVCMLILQVILFAVFPRNVEAMAHCATVKPIGSSLLGLIIFLILLPISLMLILSLVGIPLALMLWAILVSAAIFGKIGLFVALGNTLFQTDRASLFSVVLGYAVYRVLTFLPVVGKPIFVVITFLAIGICIRTGFGLKEPRRKMARATEYKRRRSSTVG
jgi:hypothetical protein